MKFQANAYYVVPVRTSLFDDSTRREEISISLGLFQVESIDFAFDEAVDLFAEKVCAQKHGAAVLKKIEQLTVTVKRIDSG